MPLRVAFRTLGCKLNQLETESIADAFARAGAVVLPSDGEGAAAELFVINTCTVTGKAERSARRAIRGMLAADPRALALVTGCYAQVDSAALAELGDRVLVLPGERKSALLGLPALLAQGFDEQPDDGADRRAALLSLMVRDWLHGIIDRCEVSAPFSFQPESFSFHSRPALKVQDGCDGACAYCRVRIARGNSTSLVAPEVLARARSLEAAGFEEIVLTGVNLSQYRDEAVDFPGLLRLLLRGTERIAFRLSSYEPNKVDEDFLEVFADSRIRPHLHLAVQSGADAVLDTMGRGYRRDKVFSAVEGLRKAKHDPFLAADLIAGFPGETEGDARATLELARGCDFAWIHAFRFSPRPGTQAASMPGQLSEPLVGLRVKVLLDLGEKGRRDYLERWTGASVQAVLELGLDATSENYLKLRPRGLPVSARPGQAISCVVEGGKNGQSSSDIDAFALYTGPSRPSHA